MTGSAHVDTFVRDRLPPPDQQPEFLFTLPELRYPERLNAAVELIDRQPTHALAVLNDAGRWTYGEMADLSDRIARLLVEEEGLVPGNRVFLRGPNNMMLFACWLGVLKAGGVVVATMPLLRPGEIATILERALIDHAIVDSRFLEDFEAAGRSGSLLTYDGDAGTGALEQRLKGIAPGFTACATHRDDPALIAFTSGTTGNPKGCIHYHRDILASADSFARHILKPAPGDRWLSTAPIAFTFGLGMQLVFPWRFGGTAVTTETPGPGALLDTIDTYYELVDRRVPCHGEPLDELRKRKILIDGAPDDLLLQIFTENQIGPIFFEIIQRKGNQGFGEGNFKALFESIELDQIRRGVVQDKT